MEHVFSEQSAMCLRGDCLTDEGTSSVLADISTLEKLFLCETEHIVNIRALFSSKTLKVLDLTNSFDVTMEGHEVLDENVTLEALALQGCRGVLSANPLGTCKALTTLDLSGTSVTNVGPLRACKALAVLDVSATGVTDAGLAGLREIPKLKRLSLRSCESITDVSALRFCMALEDLDLSETCVTSEGLAGLKDIPTLKKLAFRYCTSLTSVAVLCSLKMLKEVDIAFSGVDDEDVAVRLEHRVTLRRSTPSERLIAAACNAWLTRQILHTYPADGVASSPMPAQPVRRAQEHVVAASISPHRATRGAASARKKHSASRTPALTPKVNVGVSTRRDRSCRRLSLTPTAAPPHSPASYAVAVA